MTYPKIDPAPSGLVIWRITQRNKVVRLECLPVIGYLEATPLTLGAGGIYIAHHQDPAGGFVRLVSDDQSPTEEEINRAAFEMGFSESDSWSMANQLVHGLEYKIDD